ncbi:MAG: hypothetical protein WKG07_34535 [Hymenobacter sp.]
MLNGPYKRFYPNGRLEAQTRYADGKRDSLYVEFHANRGRRLEATYVAGTRQGPFKTYYSDGKVAQVGTFVDDEPAGPLTTYYPTGEIKLQTTLTKGQPDGAVRELYASGRPAAEVDLHQRAAQRRGEILLPQRPGAERRHAAQRPAGQLLQDVLRNRAAGERDGDERADRQG